MRTSSRLPILSKPMPKEFGHSYRPKSGLVDFMSTAGRTQSSIVSISTLQSTHKRDQLIKAQQQKKELLAELEASNLGPIQILSKLANCSTPYASLISLAAEEFEFTTGPARSQQVDDLERESTVDSAKKEVEIQQLTQKLSRKRSDATEKKRMLAKHQKALEQLNKDIDRLNQLVAFNGIHDKEEEQKPEPVVRKTDDLQDMGPIPLDDDKYKGLWREHTKLLDELEVLKAKLVETQERQMDAFKERAKLFPTKGKR